MHLRILRETVTLAYLPSIAVAVGTVVTFHEGRVDRFANQRQGQCRHHRYHGAEHHAVVDLHHPPFLAGFMDRRVGQVGGWKFVRRGRPAWFALALGKTVLTALAIEQPALLRAVVSAHGEVAVPAFAIVGTVVMLAAERREVIHDNAGSDPAMRWSGACSCCRKPGFSVQ